jgi:hypothetical protein
MTRKPNTLMTGTSKARSGRMTPTMSNTRPSRNSAAPCSRLRRDGLRIFAPRTVEANFGSSA